MLFHGSGTLLWDKAFSGGNIISLAYSRDGSTIVAGRDDGSVIVLDRTGSLLFTGTAGYWATSVAVSDNGSVIATGSIDNYVRVFDREGKHLLEYKTKNPVKYRSVAVSGDGSLVVAVDSTGVYAFSRQQYGNDAWPDLPGTMVGTATPATMTTVTETPQQPATPVSAAVPATTTHPAGMPWVAVMAALACVAAARLR
jgi:hypothetical protein